MNDETAPSTPEGIKGAATLTRMKAKATKLAIGITAVIALVSGIAAAYIWTHTSTILAIALTIVAILAGVAAWLAERALTTPELCLECRQPTASGDLFCYPEHDEQYNSTTAW